MDFAEGFAADEAFHPFDSEREFAKRKPSLGADRALPEPGEMLRRVVLRAVNDPQIFPSAAFHRWLDEAAGGAVYPLQRFDNHPFAAGSGQAFPPTNGVAG